MEIDLSNSLKKRRNEMGFTLEQLAQKVDSSKTYIWRLEKESGLNPSIKLVARIAETLCVTVDELIYPQNIREIDSSILPFINDFNLLDEAVQRGIIAQVKVILEFQKKTE